MATIDEIYDELEAAESKEVTDTESYYDGVISDTMDTYGKLEEAINTNVQTLKDAQDANTKLTIESIENQRQEAEEGLQKEQDAAYADYKKAIDQYGVNAEKMASAGMLGTGYNESSKVKMYTAYQNRVAVARSAYTKAMSDFKIAMDTATVQNNPTLAQIAFEGLQQQLKLSIEMMTTVAALESQKSAALSSITSQYSSKWQDILDTINSDREYTFSEDEVEDTFSGTYEDYVQMKANNSSSKEETIKGILNGYWFEEYTKLMEGSKKSSGAITEETASATTSSDNVPVNMDSVTALGRGDISATQLVQLIEDGLVASRIKNGERYFYNTVKSRNLYRYGALK